MPILASVRILSAASLPMPSNVFIRNCRSVRASLSPSISVSASSETFCVDWNAAKRQAHLDQKRIAAIDGRRPRRRAVKLAGHDLVQPLKDELLADRHQAIGRRRADPRVLNRLIERVGLLPADPLRIRPRRDLGLFADLSAPRPS